MRIRISWAFILLAFYRILGGYWFKEGNPLPPNAPVYTTRRVVRRTRNGNIVYED